MALARGETGRRAEALAAAFLEGRGLAIVERNFRCRRGEIDIIARDGPTLVFVEVRLRSRQDYGGAAASITAAKRSRLAAAALFYLGASPARRHAGSMRCSSTRSRRRASNGCATSWKHERAGPSQARMAPSRRKARSAKGAQ